MHGWHNYNAPLSYKYVLHKQLPDVRYLLAAVVQLRQAVLRLEEQVKQLWWQALQAADDP